MAGFRKAKAEQAAVKMGIYGPSGSGKTFTALLCAEGLANVTKKRVAFVDTEHGTDFYCQSVATRAVHPDAFDFDAIYTRSIVDVLQVLRDLDTSVYGVVVIDSISHIWDACFAAYKGKTTRVGTVPIQAWGEIKKPYKEIMALLLSMPVHVFVCGRQGNEMGENADGELVKVGVKMRAEGETQYEMHIGIRMEQTKIRKAGDVAQVMSLVEKDRTGILYGKLIVNPGFDNLIKPILPLLGHDQAKIETEEETGQKDAESMAAQDASKARESQTMLTQLKAEMDMASTRGRSELDAVSKKITSEMKKRMLPSHVAELRNHYLALSGGKPTNEEVAA